MTPDRPPSERPGLQAERTDLSWARTSLSLMVNGGILLLRHDMSSPNALELAGAAAAMALAVLTLEVSRRRRRALSGRSLPSPLADSLATLSLCAGTAMLGVITFAVISLS